MQPYEGDTEVTPRPLKRRYLQTDTDPPEQFSPRQPPSDASSELESHHSGRLSPTKQLAALEDRDEAPIHFCDFGSTKAAIPDDVQELRAKIQLLADGVGILGYQVDELASLTAPDGGLDVGDRCRFSYPWANDLDKRGKLGRMVPLADVRSLTVTAIACEDRRSHENTWNEKVHLAVIQAALASSTYATSLEVLSVKSASIDPPNLADAALPKRVVDYAIVLLPDHVISRAWKKLQPLEGAGIKSWNHTTANDVRATPIAANIETKAPNKSWTDGKAQLGIWTVALYKRICLLQEPGQGKLKIPAMPLLVAQGHDWHILFISQASSSDNHGTVIWQKMDIGSTRNCFDAYKLLAVLHLIADWACSTWQPWFRTLVAWMDQ